MTDKDLCALSKAFWEEFSPYLVDGAKPPSGEFIRNAARLAATGHENRLHDVCLAKFGLSANIEMDYVNIEGLKESHPVLPIASTIRTLDLNKKLDLLLMGHGPATMREFWIKFQGIQPQHPIYRVHQARQDFCIPIGVHCDEGTTLKKKAIMLIQWQPIVGRGSRKRKGTLSDPGLNMLGDSLTSRFVWSVMLARVYSKKKKGPNPLTDLICKLSEELANCFYKGLKLDDGNTIYLVPICLKGDWPALAKIGNLRRHFGCKSDAHDGKGICHLCCADMGDNKSWHDASWDNMLSMRIGMSMPWAKEPAIVAAIPLPDSYKPAFFRVDAFHTLHKGVLADIAANAIAT